MNSRAYSEVNLQTKIDTKHIAMILCKSCYWCASCLDGRDFESCPSCKAEKTVESIPISSDEMCVFNHDEQRGITLEFLRRK